MTITHAPHSREADVDTLLHLVDRAERGALLPAEAALLRAGVNDMATYRQWCTEWSRVASVGRARAHLLRRALRRALERARRTAAAEAELARLKAAQNPAALSQEAYADLLAAQLVDAVSLARAARRLHPVARRPPADS
ncbi:hypothetical protein P3T37_004043 [Kitasatospora sp. MAA4]|uniref:hypothetical protein n=1 Tax=Kitasatospora sp. MAA4 TaxID=3035093 RepID=UPI0024740386|nr:hypothetical protein [Kitasatospora sp. MAA4]MDH6134639.1 hypothetical protein [Kitasatospora sp. MAA4]